MPIVAIQLKNGQTKKVEMAAGFTPEDVDYVASQLEGGSTGNVSPTGYTPGVDNLNEAYAGLPADQASRVAGGVAGSILRAPVNFAEGAGQLVTHLGGAAGVLSKEQVKAYDDAVKASRAEFKSKGGDPVASDVVAGAIPVGSTAKIAQAGVKYFPQLLNAAKTGAVLGPTQFAEDGDKLSQVAWGAAFPFAAQAVAGVKAGVVNSVKRVIDAAQRARTRDVVQEAADFFRGSRAVPTPAPYTLSQQSGSPNVARLENRARGKDMVDLNARQLDEAGARFQELAREAGRQAPELLAKGSHEAVRSYSTALRNARRTGWEKGMTEFEALSAKGATPVRLDNFQKELEAVRAEDENVFALSKGVIGDKAGDMLEQLSKLPPGARFKPSILGPILKGLSRGADHSGAAFLTGDDALMAMYRKRLLDAVDKDIAAAGAKADPAIEKLKAVRARYAQESGAINELDDSVLNKLFGSRDALATPETAVEKFLALKPGDQAYALAVLNERAPSVVRGMRAHRISQALEAATENTAAASSRLNIDKFTHELFGGTDGVKGSKLFDPALKKRLLEGAAHLRVLQNNLPRGTSGGSIIWPEEAAINIVSRSPEFVARTVTRAVYGVGGDKLLGTPEGLKALRTLVNTQKAGSQATGQALAYVLSLVNQDEEAAAQ